MAAMSSTSSTLKRRFQDASSSSSSTTREIGRVERKVRRREHLSPLALQPTARTNLILPLPYPNFRFTPSEVTDIEDAQRIGFVLNPDDKRCVPTSLVDSDTKTDSSRRIYSTLKQCIEQLPSDRGPLPDDLERIVGSYYLRSQDDKRLADDVINDALIDQVRFALLQRDAKESTDVLNYYAMGRPDVALSLLRLDYGTRDLQNLLNLIVVKSIGNTEPIDHIIYSLIVHNPTWIQNIRYGVRLMAWMWGVRNLLSLLDEKKINESQLMEQVDLLNNNVFPLNAYDLENGLRSVADFLKYYRNRALAQWIIERHVESLVSRLSGIPSAPEGKRELGTLVDWFIKSTKTGCDRGTLDNMLFDAILNASAIQSIPDIGQLKLEQKLDRLWKSFQATDYKDAKMEAEINSLIAKGIGKCFKPHDLERFDLQKRIVYPVVRSFKRSSETKSGLDVWSIAPSQVQLLLTDSTEQDIKELSNLLNSLDLNYYDNLKLVDRLLERCRFDHPRLHTGCNGISSLLNERHRQSRSIWNNRDRNDDGGER